MFKRILKLLLFVLFLPFLFIATFLCIFTGIIGIVLYVTNGKDIGESFVYPFEKAADSLMYIERKLGLS